MMSKFYAFRTNFPILELDDSMLEELWKLSDEQKEYIFLHFSQDEIMKKANNFIGECEKENDILRYHNELLHKCDEIVFHDNYIEIANMNENVFVPLLKRLYKNYMILDEK